MFPIEAFRSTIENVARVLAACRVRFHLTGGVTSVSYGEPRMTQDIDLVIDRMQASADAGELVRQLEAAGFLLSAEEVRLALAEGGMFQLLDKVESLKLDVYAREMIPGELSRSIQAEVFPGMSLPIVSRADAALSKLVWVDKGSHKSRRDFRQVFQSCSAEEQKSIRANAEDFDLAPLVDELLAETDELDG